MTISFYTPRTQNGIKAQAEKLALAEAIPHMKSLEHAAKAAGFQNWRQAQKLLPVSMPQVQISVNWHDAGKRLMGTETLSYPFPRSVVETLPAMFPGFLIKDGVRMLAKGRADNQRQARRWACEVLRKIMFIEGTALKPSKAYRKAFPIARQSHLGAVYYDRLAMPGLDHESIWFDPATRGYVIANEPYTGSLDLDAERSARQKQWCEQYGYAMLQPTWTGIYNPEGGTRLFLLTKLGNGIDLPALVAKLDRLPDDFGPESWPGESKVMDYRKIFDQMNSRERPF